MTGRRDWLLQQMGISQYRLHRPGVLRGEVAIHLSAATRLLVISPEGLFSEHQLLRDIQQVLEIRDSQVMRLAAEQLAMLPTSLNCIVWFAGVEPDKAYAPIQWVTPSFSELSLSAEAKRHLWQQMCTYDRDLFPQS